MLHVCLTLTLHLHTVKEFLGNLMELGSRGLGSETYSSWVPTLEPQEHFAVLDPGLPCTSNEGVKLSLPFLPTHTG